MLVNEIIDAFRAHYDVTVEKVTLREENVSFKLPRELREAQPARMNGEARSSSIPTAPAPAIRGPAAGA